MAAGDGSFADAAARVRAIANRTANMTPVLRAIGAAMRAQVARRFDDGRDPNDVAWAPMSDATKAMRRRGRGRGEPKSLLDTGRLRRSVTFSATVDTLRFGSNLVYAAAQQFGNPRNRLFGRQSAPIPPRRYLPLSADGSRLAPEALRPTIGLIVREWIESGRVVGLEQLP